MKCVKIDDKDTRTTSMTCSVDFIVTAFSSVCIVDFEQVYVWWVPTAHCLLHYNTGRI